MVLWTPGVRKRMATNYYYRLSPATTLLRVTDGFLLNSWEAVENEEKLVVTAGIVSTTNEGQILHSGSGSTSIVTLSGASWSSAPGDTGDGSCDSCQQTTVPQTWVLEKVD
jgi:hypothetical protein